MHHSNMSPEKAIDIAKTICKVEARKSITKELYERVIVKSHEQVKIAQLSNSESWVSQRRKQENKFLAFNSDITNETNDRNAFIKSLVVRMNNTN